MTELRDYVVTQGAGLLRLAFLLTGHRQTAEDLVQTALEKVAPRWAAVVAQGPPDSYVRRTLINTHLSWRRRVLERPLAAVPDLADRGEPDADLRLVVLRALRDLPPRQRATLVLRYYLDLTEVQTAEVLGCTVGTVKSQTVKAMRSVRAQLADLAVEERR